MLAINVKHVLSLGTGGGKKEPILGFTSKVKISVLIKKGWGRIL